MKTELPCPMGDTCLWCAGNPVHAHSQERAARVRTWEPDKHGMIQQATDKSQLLRQPPCYTKSPTMWICHDAVAYDWQYQPVQRVTTRLRTNATRPGAACAFDGVRL